MSLADHTALWLPYTMPKGKKKKKKRKKKTS